MVVSAMIFFVVEVGWCAHKYFQYESNVDISVKFVEKLQFPAVTICNQNSYRLTRTRDLGLHDFMENIYAKDITGKSRVRKRDNVHRMQMSECQRDINR